MNYLPQILIAIGMVFTFWGGFLAFQRQGVYRTSQDGLARENKELSETNIQLTGNVKDIINKNVELTSINQELAKSNLELSEINNSLASKTLENQEKIEESKRERKLKLKSVIDEKIHNITGNLFFLRSMAEKAGVSLVPNKSIDSIQLIEICQKTRPNDDSNVIVIGKDRYFTWFELMKTFSIKTKKDIKELLKMAEFLTPEVIQVLNDIETSTYMVLMDAYNSGLKRNDTSLEDISEPIFEHSKLLKKLWDITS